MHRLRLVKGLYIPLFCLLICCRQDALAQQYTPPADSTPHYIQPPQPGEVSIEAVVDSPTISSNHTLTLTIRAYCIGDMNRYDFQWPSPPDLDRLEIVGSSSANRVEDRGDRLVSVKEFRYILKPVGQGEGRIGPATMHYTDKTTRREYSLSTRTLSVEVTEPVEGASGGMNAIFVLIPVFVVVVLVGGILFLRRRRRPEQDVAASPVDVRGPEEIALERLEAVPELRLAGETKEYYSAIANVLREYIDRAFSLRTMELTTPDIIDHLRMQHTDDETIAEIEKIFHICDVVKFTPHEPSPPDLDQILSMTRDFFTGRREHPLTEEEEGKEAEAVS